MYKYKVVKPRPFKSHNKIVSSTLIRNFLKSGSLNRANKLFASKSNAYEYSKDRLAKAKSGNKSGKSGGNWGGGFDGNIF